MQTIDRKDKIAIFFNITWASIALIVNYAINFFITPYITTNMGAEAYGFVALANTFTSYIDILAIAFNGFAGRYISIEYHKGNYKEANKWYNSIIVADMFLSIIVLIPSIVIINRLNFFLNISNYLLSDVKLLFIFILVKYLITVFGTAFNVATFIKNRLDILERQKSFSYILQGSILLILCVLLAPHVWYVGFAGMVSVCYILFTNIRYTHKLTKEMHFNIRDFSISYVKELISIGIWNSINNFGNILNTGLDLLITNLLLNAIIMGQMSIAKNIATIFDTLLNTFSNAFRPKQLKLYALKEIDNLVVELKNTMKLTGLISNLIFAGFFCYGLAFYKLWLPSQNATLIYLLTIIILISDIVIGVVQPLYYVFTLTKKLIVPCIITICMGVLNVISMYTLLKYTKLGVYGVLLTTLFINYIHLFDTPLYSAYCLKVRYRTFYPIIIRHFISCLIVTSVMKLFSNNFPMPASWMSLIYLAVPTGIIGLFVSIITVYSPKDIYFILKRLKLN